MCCCLFVAACFCCCCNVSGSELATALHFFSFLEAVFPVTIFFNAAVARMTGLSAVSILGFNASSDMTSISLLPSVT